MRPLFFVLLILFCPSLALASEGQCDSGNISEDSSLIEGRKYDSVITERCIRRKAEGVRVSCDSCEIAVSVFCEQNGSVNGVYSALVTTGVIGRRTGVCLWSAPTDGTIVVNCRKIGKKYRGDAAGDVYSKYAVVKR